MKKIYLYGTREERNNYCEALEACGARPVPSLDVSDAFSCDGVLLCGGGDIEPFWYGQENNGSKNFEPQRDEAEIPLVKACLEKGLPVLGICRGLQVMNVALGGTLIQHLPTAAAHAWEESTGDKQHLVQAAPGSFLERLYGKSFSVNSAHHQGAGEIAPLLQVAARADDGVIEALCCPQKRLYAVQWHPERMMLSRSRPDTVDGTALFTYFLSLV